MSKRQDPERLLDLKVERVRHELGDEAPPEQQPPAKKTRLTNAVALSLAEQRIQEAIERGEFDQLQGAGKPLDLNDDLHVPEELRMAFRLLKNNGYAPPWVEIRRELLRDEQQLRRFQESTSRHWPGLGPAERAKAQSHVRALVKELNSRILSYNLSAPSSSVHLELYRVEDEIMRLEA